MTPEATEKATLDTGYCSDYKNRSPLHNKPEKKKKRDRLRARNSRLYVVERGTWDVEFETGRAALSSWPVALLGCPTDEDPADWEPGPAGTAPGRGCSAGGQSGNPGGGESGRGVGWCVSGWTMKRIAKIFQWNLYIWFQLNECKGSRGLLLTMWATLILFIPRGGPENRPRTARISDTVGFSPFWT